MPFIYAEKQTTTEEKSVSLEMESLGQLNVSSKSIDIGSIWNEAFLNRVWSKNHGRKRINAHKNATEEMTLHQSSPWNDEKYTTVNIQDDRQEDFMFVFTVILFSDMRKKLPLRILLHFSDRIGQAVAIKYKVKVMGFS